MNIEFQEQLQEDSKVGDTIEVLVFKQNKTLCTNYSLIDDSTTEFIPLKIIGKGAGYLVFGAKDNKACINLYSIGHSRNDFTSKIEDIDDYHFMYFWVPSDVIARKSFKQDIKVEGSTCNGCKTYSMYSVPNQENGKFKCFSCRTYPHYR